MVSFQEHQNRRLGRIDPEMGRGKKTITSFVVPSILI